MDFQKRDVKKKRTRKSNIPRTRKPVRDALFFEVPNQKLPLLITCWEQQYDFENCNDELYIREETGGRAAYTVGIKVEPKDANFSEVIMVMGKKTQDKSSWVRLNEVEEPLQSKLTKLIYGIQKVSKNKMV